MLSQPDLSGLHEQLESIFKTYPAGNYCELCAHEVSKILKDADFEVEIITIQNEMTPGMAETRPPFIHARGPGGEIFLLGETGFHMVVRVNQLRYIDSLIYLHHGVATLVQDEYFQLFHYPDGIEITRIQSI